jgi:hypothetical protein
MKKKLFLLSVEARNHTKISNFSKQISDEVARRDLLLCPRSRLGEGEKAEMKTHEKREGKWKHFYWREAAPVKRSQMTWAARWWVEVGVEATGA